MPLRGGGRWGRWVPGGVIAPKGRNIIARGEAPGSDAHAKYTSSPEGAKHHSPGRSPGTGRSPEKMQAPKGRNTLTRRPPRSRSDDSSGGVLRPSGAWELGKMGRPRSQGYALGWDAVPLRGVGMGKGRPAPVPGLRSGLGCYAPSGRWPLGAVAASGGDEFRAVIAPKGRNIIARGKAPGSGAHAKYTSSPEGAKDHSPGRSPGTGRSSKKMQAPKGRNTLTRRPPPARSDDSSGGVLRPSGAWELGKMGRPRSQGFALGWDAMPLRGVGLQAGGCRFPYPGLRPGLGCCAPSGAGGRRPQKFNGFSGTCGPRLRRYDTPERGGPACRRRLEAEGRTPDNPSPACRLPTLPHCPTCV